MLDLFNCFDAEMYADELELEEPIEFREDQRSKSISFHTWPPHLPSLFPRLARCVKRERHSSSFLGFSVEREWYSLHVLGCCVVKRE